MKVLELFSGHGDIAKSFKEKGHETFTVDWSEDVNADLTCDVSELTVGDVVKLCGGVPDVVWASPQCTTYSIATHKHRTVKEGLQPKTEMAKQDDVVNVKMWKLIDALVKAGTKYYFVENPRGRMRHMDFVKDRERYTVTYCSYGNKGTAKGFEDVYVMKPTDIWTNHKKTNFLNTCKKGTHKHGDWGYVHKRDYLSRGTMPKELCDHIVRISEV
jgi:site-specific DNA-cytosine methylase